MHPFARGRGGGGEGKVASREKSKFLYGTIQL